jgi:hypothetical protein
MISFGVNNEAMPVGSTFVLEGCDSMGFIVTPVSSIGKADKPFINSIHPDVFKVAFKQVESLDGNLKEIDR